MGERKGPCLYISGLTRTTTRADWKWFYRYKRVELREQEKANMDMWLYGNGFMSYPNGGDPRHVPIQEVKFDV